MSLTTEQVRRYLESKGLKCPHCRSEEITSGPILLDAETGTAEVCCEDCDEEWTDQYLLVGINAVES